MKMINTIGENREYIENVRRQGGPRRPVRQRQYYQAAEQYDARRDEHDIGRDTGCR